MPFRGSRKLLRLPKSSTSSKADRSTEQPGHLNLNRAGLGQIKFSAFCLLSHEPRFCTICNLIRQGRPTGRIYAHLSQPIKLVFRILAVTKSVLIANTLLGRKAPREHTIIIQKPISLVQKA